MKADTKAASAQNQAHTFASSKSISSFCWTQIESPINQKSWPENKQVLVSWGKARSFISLSRQGHRHWKTKVPEWASVSVLTFTLMKLMKKTWVLSAASSQRFKLLLHWLRALLSAHVGKNAMGGEKFGRRFGTVSDCLPAALRWMNEWLTLSLKKVTRKRG